VPAAAPSTPPFRLGLNGVFIGNSTLTTEQQLVLFEEVGVAALRHVTPNDVGWSSVQAANGLFKFTAADSVLASAHGFGFLPTFYGADSQNYYVPPGVAATNSWSSTAYGAQTTTYLQTVVNRYKASIRYWEIANEMNVKTTPPAGFSAADYAAFLIYSHDAIIAADPSAQVVISGLLGNYGYPIANAYQWLRDVLSAGGGAGFDVFNYHDYKSWWTLPAHYDQYRAILDQNGLQNTPIWVTETAQASRIRDANVNPAYCSVDGQAAETWRRPCLLFGKGAQTVFWHSFWANSSDTSGFHDMGLVDATTGIRKKAWYSFRLLNQKIEGFASATLISQGVSNDDNVTGGSGAWVVRFDFADGTRRWVAWSPDGQTTTLSGLDGIQTATLTTVVPATLSADGATVTWTTASNPVNAGVAALVLTDSPILIEAAPGYAAWRTARFTSAELADGSISGPDADPDADGVGNLLEYAFGSDPRSASQGLLPNIAIETDGAAENHLTLALRLAAGATDLALEVELSDDLQTWRSGAVETETVSENTALGVRTWIVRDRTPLTATGRRFARLRATTL